jgi:glucose-1-phosphate cytidylyltransferase
MKVVILCGGQGTRIRDVSEVLPKPMLPIGDRPILWHIMKIYAHYGFHDFVLCLGYKGWVIKDFFLNYLAKTSDISLTLGDKNSITYHHQNDELNWNVTLVDTGEDSKTGTRLANVRSYLDLDDCFAVTYGDGVADVDVRQVVKTHQASKKIVTITGVQPLGRFGEIEVEGSHIKEFNEKPNVSRGLINGGFMVFSPDVFKKYLNSKNNLSLESDVLPKIVKDQKAGVYKHKGSWQCIDTPREYTMLNELWNTQKAFWKIWE